MKNKSITSKKPNRKTVAMNLSVDPDIKNTAQILAEKRKLTVSAYVTQLVLDAEERAARKLGLLPECDGNDGENRKAN